MVLPTYTIIFLQHRAYRLHIRQPFRLRTSRARVLQLLRRRPNVVWPRPRTSCGPVAQHIATEPRLRPSFFATVS